MTLNQAIRRIQTITLAHKQIRRFKVGIAGDFFADKDARFPAACLQYISGTLSTQQSAVLTVSFRLFLLDLVHVSEGTNDNQDDVLSDMLSVILDLVAQMNRSEYSDWAFGYNNNLQVIIENENDLSAGWYIDFTIRIPIAQNVCQIPTDLFGYPSGSDSGSSPSTPGTGIDIKSVYDLKYVADGTEGKTIVVPAVNGKRVLFMTREASPIYKVSSAPDSAEYVFDGVDITLGADTEAGERFLILYRNN